MRSRGERNLATQHLVHRAAFALCCVLSVACGDDDRAADDVEVDTAADTRVEDTSADETSADAADDVAITDAMNDTGCATCGEQCVDLEFDRWNCGECGNACELAEICAEGSCTAASCTVTCGADETCCNAECCSGACCGRPLRNPDGTIAFIGVECCDE